MLSKSHPVILFIDRNGFSVYQDTLTSIPKFNFTPDLVVNLDVINKDQFSKLIVTFIEVNKIVPSSLAIILSDNVIYFKDLINKATPTAPEPEEIQSFLENVPFEEVLARVIKIDQLSRIVAVNKDLVMTIADAFVNKGSSSEAIIPSFLYGPSINFTQGITQENAQAILGNPDILRIGNLLTDQEKVASLPSLEEHKDKEKKPRNLRQFILIGVFIFLLIILGVVYFTGN